jgi:hypothetical protein
MKKQDQVIRIVGEIQATSIVKIKALLVPIFGSQSLTKDRGEEITLKNTNADITIYEYSGSQDAYNYLISGFFTPDLATGQLIAGKIMEVLTAANIAHEIDVSIADW